jgi:hypothetical protein
VDGQEEIALVLSLLVFSGLGAAASAEAADRYASPTGSGSSTTCAQSAKCSLIDALDPTKTADGDSVILDPGVYNVASTLTILEAVHVRGTGAPADTKIVSSVTATNGLNMTSSGARLSNLELDSVSTDTGLYVTSGTVSRVIVRNPAPTTTGACRIGSGTIVGSLCVSTTAGLRIELNAGVRSISLLNSTFIGGTSSFGLLLSLSGAILTLNASSVIFHGGGQSIIHSISSGSLTFTADHSNFVTQVLVGDPPITFPAVGSGTNQSTPPLFTNAAAGDYSEAPGSPTINSGAVGAQSEPFDLKGSARTQGGAPDIGAFEFDQPDPPNNNPFIDVTKPTIKITKRPKSKTTSKKLRVKFNANEAATFKCKLDKGKFKSCKSPYKKSKLKLGKHKLQIKATDAAGNVSSTKTIKWTVKAP